jgi:hypothetical protein
MNLNELKQESYSAWEYLHQQKRSVIQPEAFKSEVRTFGNLRYKATWRKAFAAFQAQTHWHSGITEHTAIVYVFGDSSSEWDSDLRRLMLEYFLMIPGAVEFISRGLEQIYSSNDKEDRECANELLQMVSRESEGSRTYAFGGAKLYADGFVRRLTGSHAS